MTYQEFYAELGKLQYAVADIDKVITQKEKEKLQNIVRKELVPAEMHVDLYGTDSAYYSEMEFDILDDQIADADDVFESFIDFVVDHHTAIDEKMKKVSLHVARELAKAYRGVNNREHMLLKKLRQKLEKIETKK